MLHDELPTEIGLGAPELPAVVLQAVQKTESPRYLGIISLLFSFSSSAARLTARLDKPAFADIF